MKNEEIKEDRVIKAKMIKQEGKADVIYARINLENEYRKKAEHVLRLKEYNHRRK